MKPKPRDIWFPAKRYGWGWGLPIAWQGWAVLATYAVLLAVGIHVFPRARTPGFFLYAAAITAGLIAVCRLKGETPRWRWGRDD